jgi:hypothetical protein
VLVSVGLIVATMTMDGGRRVSAQLEPCRGMTWSLIETSGSYVHAGSDWGTDPYNGDTSANTYLPLLCVLVDHRAAPGSLAFDFYNGWVRGALAATSPIAGWSLTSQSQGDAICAGTFGSGWRMAEFHDGYYPDGNGSSGGWSYWGEGTLPSDTRFWVAINDQPANPWNSGCDSGGGEDTLMGRQPTDRRQ